MANSEYEIESIRRYMFDAWNRLCFLEKVFNNQFQIPKLISYEIIMVQYRKILETIAFIGVVNHKEDIENKIKDLQEKGESQKKIKQYNYKNWWKAKDIISIIEEFNPNYYPEPVIHKEHEIQPDLERISFE